MKERVEQLILEALGHDQVRLPKSNFEACAFCYYEYQKAEDKLNATDSNVRSAWKATKAGAKPNVMEARFRAIYKGAVELAVCAIEMALLSQRVLKAIKGGRT